MTPHEVKPSEKRRLQNRESQRRFREKHRAAQGVSWSTEPSRKSSKFREHQRPTAAAARPQSQGSATLPAMVLGTPAPASQHTAPPTAITHDFNAGAEWDTTKGPSGEFHPSSSWITDTTFSRFAAPELPEFPSSHGGPVDGGGLDNKPLAHAGYMSQDIHDVSRVLVSPISGESGQNEISQGFHPPQAAKTTPHTMEVQYSSDPRSLPMGASNCMTIPTPDSVPAMRGAAHRGREARKRSANSSVIDKHQMSHTSRQDSVNSDSGSGGTEALSANLGVSLAGDSKAEKMIDEVKRLYAFGVTVGILPEDRVIVGALQTMKERFHTLSQRQLRMQNQEASPRENYQDSHHRQGKQDYGTDMTSDSEEFSDSQGSWNIAHSRE